MALANALAPDDHVISVNYFSALASWNNDKVIRHRDYARALENAGVAIFWGDFADKDKMGLVKSVHNSISVTFFGRSFTTYRQKIYTHEEKQTDVAIGVQMYRMASKGIVEKIMLLSNDTDFAPALEEISKDFPHIRLKVYAPVSASKVLPSRIRGIVTQRHHKHLDLAIVAQSQFPNPVVLPDGTQIQKPSSW